MTRRRERSVRIAELKANLSKHIRAAQRGDAITILDRDTPVARIVQARAEPAAERPARLSWKNLDLPPPIDIGGDIVDLLLEDRRRR